MPTTLSQLSSNYYNQRLLALLGCKMQALKKLVGRRSMVASAEVGKMKGTSLASSFRPPSVVTSTAFDDDTIFQTVAKAMLFRLEIEGLCVREAINATLLTTEDKRGFLESLDLRISNIYSNLGEEEIDVSGMTELVEQIRFTFGETLKILWRESITGYDGPTAGFTMEEDIVDTGDNEYRPPLKTPKNHRLHSPIQAISVALGTHHTNCSIQQKNSGRQRRRFFPDSAEPRRCRPRLFLDFKIARGEQQVQSLQLDGADHFSSLPYVPPSPIATTA